MTGFYHSLVPTTEAMREYVGRGIAKSIVWAPGRMVDQAEEILAQWRRNDNSGEAGSSAFLPVVAVAMAKDYSPVPGDFSRQLAEGQYVMIPADTKERIFKLRQAQGDRRTQIVIFAADEPTARSIATQFGLWVAQFVSRTFDVPYQFAGFTHLWPAMLESTDAPAQNIQHDQKNLTILACDIVLRETIPMFSAPKEGEPNDGKGTDPVTDPSGYPGLQQVTMLDQVEQVWSDTTAGADRPTWNAGTPPA